MFFPGLLICVCLLGGHAFSKSLPIFRIKMFSSHGESSFKTIVNENDFYCDKTSFISKLESAGKFLKIWRPRQFGKTLVCDMLKEYYDKTNSQEKVSITLDELKKTTFNLVSPWNLIDFYSWLRCLELRRGS
jgi:hypothetical protein